MSFRYEAFYLVEPRPELAERLRDCVAPELADLLMEPLLYRRQENTGSNWLAAERLLQVKLLFLADLRQYTPLAEDAGFTRVFGSAQISMALFDRWWTARRFQVEEELETLEERLCSCKDRIEPTGSSKVDDWVSSL